MEGEQTPVVEKTGAETIVQLEEKSPVKMATWEDLNIDRPTETKEEILTNFRGEPLKFIFRKPKTADEISAVNEKARALTLWEFRDAAGEKKTLRESTAFACAMMEICLEEPKLTSKQLAQLSWQDGLFFWELWGRCSAFNNAQAQIEELKKA